MSLSINPVLFFPDYINQKDIPEEKMISLNQNDEQSFDSVPEIFTEDIKKGKVAPSWTREENQKYAYFLRKHQELFKCERRRRIYKVFKLLSQWLLSKTMKQCKSHHQKMLKRFGCNNRIICQFLGPNTIKEVKIEQGPIPMINQEEVRKIESKQQMLQLTLQQTKQGSSMPDQVDLFSVLDLNYTPMHFYSQWD